MGKITSVNLDEQAVEYFQRENINVSAWIRDIMEQRMTGGEDIDVTQMRIRELEREREDLQTELKRIEEQLAELRDKRETEEQVEEAKLSFGTEVIQLHKEFQAFPTSERLRQSTAFRKRATELDMSVFEAADTVIAYRQAIGNE